jgi:aryl-alcohol dehydrogenase-like predicted oxidoreductase
VGPIVDALDQHVVAGRIRALGVSNWSTRRIAAAADYARSHGRQRFVVSSVQFSLAAWRSPPWRDALTLSRDENAPDREWYKASDMWLLAYSSLAMGFFSRARSYADGAQGVPAAESFGDRIFLDANNLARLERTRALARQRGVSPGQIALAWVLRHHSRVLAIVGARSLASYTDAAGACSLELSEAERGWLSHGD